MTDAAPDILYTVDRSGDPVAFIESREEAGAEDVLERYPGMITGEHTTELAKLVNHFARKFEYEVIDDPAAFAAAYRAQIASEDADATWQQGVQRLRDFGMPDLESITLPTYDGSRLVYFARSVRYGVPYRAEVEIQGTEIGEASYKPMKMSAIVD